MPENASESGKKPPAGEPPSTSTEPLTEAQLEDLFEQAKRELAEARPEGPAASDPLVQSLSAELVALKRIFDRKK